MSEADAAPYEPREASPAINLDNPPADLGVDTGSLIDWTESSRLPNHRIPPKTDKTKDEEEGSYWALLDDVIALRENRSLKPAAEIHDDLRRVYVIDLEDCPLAAHEGKSCLYVGESWHPARARFIQHLVGYKSGKGHVRKWGTRLRPDLYLHLRAVRTSVASRKVELDTARRLADEGYAIHGVRLES